MTSYLNVLLSKLYLEVFWVFSGTYPHYEAKSHWNFLSPKKNFHWGKKKIFFFGWKWLKTHSKSISDEFFFFVHPSTKQNGRRTKTIDSRPMKLIHIIDILMAHVCAKIEKKLSDSFCENCSQSWKLHVFRRKWPPFCEKRENQKNTSLLNYFLVFLCKISGNFDRAKKR